ncbi:hypothetical protein [Candidatus Uabimicrobium amorphum]|uniref:HEAT repeat domain-containing protein n=1 Tax=Uabimicrobium amorphum TaxID=2596890 RepID=A0A5S9IKI3_UABAM|nr:hypothetical protein [Candidatus Uabimicrobium amorphum]BBM83230.1 hypothetical protein UABAM_01581 [Candidatus Uabimicrobium amorphum]
MQKVLHNWWAWLLCIIVVRLVFVAFGEPVLQPSETAIQVLINNVQNDEDASVREAAAQTLRESITAFPQYRQKVMEQLRELAKEKAHGQDIAKLVSSIESDPLYQLSIAVEKPNLPMSFYLEPLLYAIPIIYGLAFVLFFPLFINYVVGHRATLKLYGRGKTVMYMLIFTTWCSSIVIWGFYKEWFIISHILLVVTACIVLFLTVVRKMLMLFLNVQQKVCWVIFVALFCLGGASFIPYTNRSEAPQVKISREKILTAIQSLQQKHYVKAKPLLTKILYNRIYNEPQIIQETLRVLGKIADPDSLHVINAYLSHANVDVRKTATDTTLQIVKKMSQQ